MKNLNEMGVMELRGNEMREVDGGSCFHQVAIAVGDFFEGIAAGYVAAVSDVDAFIQ